MAGDDTARPPVTPHREMPAGYSLRLATVADARTIAEYRRLMFTAMGDVVPGRDDSLVDAMERHVQQELPIGRLVDWIVEHAGRPVAGGIVVLQAIVPSPGALDGAPAASIQNIWTEPEHRRRGLAGLIVEAMIEWCRERSIRRLFLNATEDGRGVYASFGFRASTTAMTLTLSPDDPS